MKISINNLIYKIHNNKNFNFTLSLALGDFVERILNLFVNLIIVLSFTDEIRDQFLNTIVLTGFVSLFIGFLSSYPMISDKKFSKVTSVLMSILSQIIYIFCLLVVCLTRKLSIAELAGLFIVAGPSMSRIFQILLRIVGNKKYLNIYILIRFLYMIILFPILFFLFENPDSKLKLTFIVGLIDAIQSFSLSFIYLYSLIKLKKVLLYIRIFYRDLFNLSTLNNFSTQQLNSLLANLIVLSTIYLPFLNNLKLEIFYAFKLCNYVQLPANYIQLGRFRDDLVPPLLIKSLSKLLQISLVIFVFCSLSITLLPNFEITFLNSTFLLAPTLLIFISLSSLPRAQSAFLFDLNLRQGNYLLLYKSYIFALLLTTLFLFIPFLFINSGFLNSISILCISSGSMISYLVLTWFLSKYKVKPL